MAFKKMAPAEATIMARGSREANTRGGPECTRERNFYSNACECKKCIVELFPLIELISIPRLVAAPAAEYERTRATGIREDVKSRVKEDRVGAKDSLRSGGTRGTEEANPIAANADVFTRANGTASQRRGAGEASVCVRKPRTSGMRRDKGRRSLSRSGKGR